MSALFKARVEKLDGQTAQIRLFIIHPDQTRFYLSKNFVLQVLWDAFGAAKKDSEGSPLAQAISTAQILDSSYVVGHHDDFIHVKPYYAIGGTFIAGLFLGWFMSRK